MSGPILDVAVVGGGMAGLSAAFELQQRGKTVRVLDAGPRAGGVVLTDRFDGWTVDAGPDSLLVQKPGAITLCKELGIADRLQSTLTPRTAYVLRDGRLHPLVEGSFLGFPLSASALARSSLFSWPGKIRMALEAVVPARSSQEDEALSTFVRRRFGREATTYLADPLLAGIHAGDADRLSAHALFPRLVQAERTAGSLLRAFRALRTQPSPKGAFASLPGGTAELVESLTGALAPGTLVCNARVTGMRHGNTFVLDHGNGSTASRAVILAIPAYAAATLLSPFSEQIATLCRSIPYASTATVAFGYRREQIAHSLNGTGFVVPRVEPCPLLAGTWVSSKWPGRAPDGHALLRGFLGGGRDPHRLDAPDDELVRTAREALSTLLGIEGDALFSRLYRWTRQSPQYEVGHLGKVRAIQAGLVNLPGIFVAGSGFRAIGIPDCITDGRETAARAGAFAIKHQQSWRDRPA
jgi:oxygen-dependent protoporphyrinogen oxidase